MESGYREDGEKEVLAIDQLVKEFRSDPSSSYAVTPPDFAAAADFIPQGRLPLRANYLLRLRRLPAPVERRRCPRQT